MSCSDFFGEYIEWIEGSARRHVWCTLVSNQRDGVCSYAVGRLQYTRGGGGGGPMSFVLPGTFEGDLPQTFSNRFGAGGSPFSPEAADVLGVRLTLSDPPRVRLTLRSWGGGRSSFSVTCDNGVLLASPASGGFVISLQKVEVPV